MKHLGKESHRNLNKCRLSGRYYFIFTSGISTCSRTEKNKKIDTNVRSIAKLIIYRIEQSSLADFIL